MANRPQFSEGDWVFYFNPGHQWHLMLMQIAQIVPMTAYDPGGYLLEFGGRQVTARVNQVLHRRDSQVQNQVLNPSHSVDTACGVNLDMIGAMYGIKRKLAEPDASYRRAIQAQMPQPGQYFVNTTSTEELDKRFSPMPEYGHDLEKFLPMKRDSHEGHEVIENWAGGKPFKYCRKCKVEVM